MPALFQNISDLVRKVYILARPYGRRKLLLVTTFSFAQGLFQVLGVTSIFPFLALAADPARLRNSEWGSVFLDLAPPMSDTKLLIVAGTFALLMLVLANGMNLAAEYIRTNYAHRFGHWLRTRLLRKIASRRYTDFLLENSAVLVKKVVSDVMNFTTGVLLTLLDSFARIATIVLLVATLFLVHPGIALAATLGLGLFYFAIFKSFAKWRRNTSAGLNESNHGIHIEVHQLLGGIKPVKVHRCEEVFLDRFSNHSSRYANLMGWAGIVSNAPRYLVEPLAFGGVVIAVLFYAARGQELTVILPNLGVMALAGYRLLPAIQLLYAQVQTLSIMRHSLDEVFDEFLAAEQTTGKDTETATGHLSSPAALAWSDAITLENVEFRYPHSGKSAVRNLTLTIRKNTSLGIIGSTGCGKSTLVDLILGLHAPTAGQILVDDTPLGPDNRRAWRGGIGYVPQEIFLIDDTVASNIAFGVPSDQIDHPSLKRAAAAAQILDFIEQDLSEQFNTVVGERGVRLSGGQRQRIGLARALYHQPDLLILDEATSALDSETEDGVMKALADLNGRLTMVVVAHRVRTVEMCDEILDLT